METLLSKSMSANEHAVEARAAFAEVLSVYAMVMGLGLRIVGLEKVRNAHDRYIGGSEHYDRSGLYKAWLYSLARAAEDADWDLHFEIKGMD